MGEGLLCGGALRLGYLLGPPGVTPPLEFVLPFGGATVPGIEFVPFGVVVFGVVVVGVVAFGIVAFGAQPFVLVLVLVLEPVLLLVPELIVPVVPVVGDVDVETHGPLGVDGVVPFVVPFVVLELVTLCWLHVPPPISAGSTRFGGATLCAEAPAAWAAWYVEAVDDVEELVLCARAVFVPTASANAHVPTAIRCNCFMPALSPR
ncbi:MAG: hypothetical protein ACRENA_04105 [Vulcanimicrobiaceae bacterium]